MAQPDNEYCGRCRYFIEAKGECHRHPPNEFVASGIMHEAHWPKVAMDAWCGDYGKPLGGPTIGSQLPEGETTA